MSTLYEEVYKQKQAKYKLDGDLKSFNQFISLAHDYQFAVIIKQQSENNYIEWLMNQRDRS